jgi:hypothetical protein
MQRRKKPWDKKRAQSPTAPHVDDHMIDAVAARVAETLRKDIWLVIDHDQLKDAIGGIVSAEAEEAAAIIRDRVMEGVRLIIKTNLQPLVADVVSAHCGLLLRAASTKPV